MAALTDDELRRYARQVALPEIGRSGQERLKRARIAVVGAGGLGSPALLYLAAAGVGTLTVIDDDTVDVTNLHRQVLFGPDDVGRPKVLAAQDALRRLNPLVTVVPRQVRLDDGNAADLLAGHDVVLDGCDNAATRYLVNDTCVRLRIPCVWAAVAGLDGQVGVSFPPHGPCYRCLFPEPPDDADAACSGGGVLGVLCGAVGLSQATEALKRVLALGRPLVGHVLVQSFDAVAPHVLRVPRDPDCTTCAAAGDRGHDDAGGVDRSRTTSVVLTVHELPDAVAAGAVVIDLRERTDGTPGLPDAVRLPASHLTDPGALDGLPQDRPLVLYCATGARSAAAAGLLRTAGYPQARSLAGGLRAWSVQRGAGSTDDAGDSGDSGDSGDQGSTE